MLLLLMILFASPVLSKYPSCFDEGFTWPHDDVLDGIPNVMDPYQCQQLSSNITEATHFTWNSGGALPNFCVVFRDTRAPVACMGWDCVSGPTVCPRCSKEYSCVVMEDNLIDFQPSVPTELECQDFCFNSPDCNFYTWFSEAATIYHLDCFLFSSCSQIDENCSGCFTGPAKCQESSSTQSPVTTTTDISTTAKPTAITTSARPTPITTTARPTTMTTKARPTTMTTTARLTTMTTTATPTTMTTTARTTTIPTTTRPTPMTTTARPTTMTTTARPTPMTTTARPTTMTTTAQPTTTSPDCSIPSSQNHAYWHCSINPISIPAWSLECILDCDSGYVPSNNSMTSCSGGSWTIPPEEMTCTVGVALITGGFNEDAKRSVEIYSADGSCSRTLPSLPDDRTDHTVDLVDGNVLLCGGDYTQTDCIELHADQMWYTHSTTNQVRYDHSSVVTLGQLTLLGGRYSTTESLSPSNGNTWSDGYPLLEKTRYACTVKVSPDSYIIIGGQNFPNHVIQYNATNGESGRLQNLQTGRWLHGCTMAQNNSFTGVLVAGGYDTGDELSSTELFHIEDGRWLEVGHLNTGRHSLELVQLNSSVLAMGGNAGESFLDTVEMFELETMKWSFTRELLQGRASHAVTTVPSNMFNCPL